MAASEDRNLGILDGDTTIANSAVVMADDRTALVELAPDHPGLDRIPRLQAVLRRVVLGDGSPAPRVRERIRWWGHL